MNININKFSFLHKPNKINLIKEDKKIELDLNNRTIYIDKTKNISMIEILEDKDISKIFLNMKKYFTIK